MTVCVVGRDSVAATLATEIARRNVPVVLYGLPPEAMAAMAGNCCPFPEEPDLAPAMVGVLGDGRLRAGAELGPEVAGARLTIVVARLELDEEGDLDYRWLDRTSAEVAEGLCRDSAVLYDGMLGVGDTRRRFGPILEQGSGLRMGQEFGLAFSPERSRPGHVLYDLRLRPKLVGAIDDRTRAGVMEFLQGWIDNAVMGLESLEAAEYVPLMEAAARHVHAALGLEFAALARAHGVNIHGALTALDTQAAFPVCSPALMANGPEVAVAARLLERAGADAGAADDASLLALARRIHGRALDGVLVSMEELGGPLQGKQVLVLAAEAETGDPPPASPLGRLVAGLRGRGAVPRLAAAPLASGRETVEAIVVVHPRLHFAALELETFPRCRLLVDGTGAIPPRRVEAAGIRFVGP